jgi:fluoride exporter
MSSELPATIWVGIGGGLGGVARYAIEQLMVRLAGAVVWGTLLVNVLGSFLIAYLGEPVLMQASFGTAPDIRFLVAIGVFGGFTTFASFSLQTLELIRDAKIVRAILYTVGSVALCLGGAALGIYAAGLDLPTLA